MGVPHYKENIRQLECALERAQTEPPTTQNLARQKHLCHEIFDLLEREEIYWKQRSHVDWLRNDDKNTNFFHKRAS